MSWHHNMYRTSVLVLEVGGREQAMRVLQLAMHTHKTRCPELKNHVFDIELWKDELFRKGKAVYYSVPGYEGMKYGIRGHGNVRSVVIRNYFDGKLPDQ